MDKARLFRTGLLTAIIALGAVGVRYAEGQVPSPLRTLTLREETLRVPFSALDLNPATTYGIDYYDLSNTSYATRAADVRMTLGNLCHVGQIPRTKYQIVQRCPAETNRANRLKEWRDFVGGKGRAPIPKNSDLYFVRNGRDLVPLVEREVTKWDDLNWKRAIRTPFSPACAFPNPALGERITELCAQSLPVRLPPFAATITGGEVVVSRLTAGPARAYLVVTSQGREVARAEVRVETKVVAPSVGSQPPVAPPQAPGRVCSFGGTNYGVGDSVVVFPSATVASGGRCEGVSFFCRQPDPKRPLVAWYRAGNRRADPWGVLWCRVEPPLCPQGKTPLEYSLIDNDYDGFFVPAEVPPGKRSAVVCVPPGTKLPYRDEMNRKGYATSVAPLWKEDPQCDNDSATHVYVDLPSYFGDGDRDGYWGEYKSPIRGCIKKPQNQSYLGEVERYDGKFMPITARDPGAMKEGAATDGDPNKPASQSSSSSSSVSSGSSTGWRRKKCCVCLFEAGEGNQEEQCSFSTDCGKWQEEQSDCSITATHDMAHLIFGTGEPFDEFLTTVCGGADEVAMQFIRHGCPKDVCFAFGAAAILASVSDAETVDLTDDACLVFDQLDEAQAAAEKLRQRLQQLGSNATVRVTSNQNVTAGNISSSWLNTYCSPVTFEVCATGVTLGLHPCHYPGTPCTVDSQTRDTWRCKDRDGKARTMVCRPNSQSENDNGDGTGQGHWEYIH